MLDMVALETAALARVLGAACSGDAAPPSSSSSMPPAFFACSSPAAATPGSSSAGSPFAPSRSASASPRPPHPRPLQPSAGVAAGRISKRKPRRSPARPSSSSSRRDGITYIEAEPARFRDMVQQMTGMGVAAAAPQPELQMVMNELQHVATTRPALQFQPQAASMPALRTSEGLIGTVSMQQQQILSSLGISDDPYSFFLPEFNCALDEMLMTIPDLPQQQQPQPQRLPPCFPTLESWSA